jgi:hypothetical protein
MTWYQTDNECGVENSGSRPRDFGTAEPEEQEAGALVPQDVVDESTAKLGKQEEQLNEDDEAEAGALVLQDAEDESRGCRRRT